MKIRGFTLIEVLISLAILAIGVVVIIKFQADMLRNMGSTQQQSEAVSLAENKLNELRNYVSLTTAGGTPSYEQIVNGSQTTTNNNTTYTTSWVVTTVSSPPYKTVAITVSWTNSANQTESVSLESIIGAVDPAKTGQVMQGL